MSFDSDLKTVQSAFRTAFKSSGMTSGELESLRIQFLGRKGEISALFHKIGQVSDEEKPLLGKRINYLKQECQSLYDDARNAFSADDRDGAGEYVDYTLPGITHKIGTSHPLETILDEIKSIFSSIGFSIAYGPEIDDDFHNFEALNIPRHHPARDMQDTFFIDKNTVLRTHTSNVQIHLMESMEPPLKCIVPGRVYRNEAISYKSYCLFHQVEGLYINKNVSFSELKGTLEYFIHSLFGSDTKIRLRPSFFPFTEPSAEVDLWDDGRNQWMEILGCGMVDPQVLSNVGYDPDKWDGYAFGLGIERMAMLKYKINDIRLFYQSDLRFLEQF
jgi:phenylalanyl-tRNA synthetase alpha chain